MGETMKAVKINRRQLRNIISEELGRLKEATNADRHHAALKHNPNTVVSKAADDVAKFWNTLYDERDPSQAAAGEQAWADQVELASDELHERFTAALAAVDAKLMDGEYLRR